MMQQEIYNINLDDNAIEALELILNSDIPINCNNTELLVLETFFSTKNFESILQSEITNNNNIIVKSVNEFFNGNQNVILYFYQIINNIGRGNYEFEEISSVNFDTLEDINLEHSSIKLVFYSVQKAIIKMMYWSLLDRKLSDTEILDEYLHYSIDDIIDRDNTLQYHLNFYSDENFRDDIREEYIGKECNLLILDYLKEGKESTFSIYTVSEIVKFLKNIFYLILKNLYYQQLISRKVMFVDKDRNSTLTYKWIENKKPKSLNNFYKILDSNNIISNISYSDFKKFFSEVDSINIYKRLNMNGFGDAELIYLVLVLENNGFLSKSKHFDWDKFLSVFETNSVKSQLRPLKSKIIKDDEDNKCLSDKSLKRINDLVNSILK